MKSLFALSLMLLAAFGGAQDFAKKQLEASPRHHEWVVVKNGTRDVHSFVAYPERKEKAPVVIVIHENMGLTDWVMSAADQFAERGYIAIAPDLLSGMGPNGGRTKDFADGAKAREAIYALPQGQVTEDLNAVAAYSKTIAAANNKLWVAGFCWGGSQTFHYATQNPNIEGGLVFYGTGPQDEKLIVNIKAPVYGFYGGNDERVNATIPTSEKLMKDAGKKYEPVIYEGAGHGFMRAGEMPDASEANKKARELAWGRVMMLIGK